MVPFHWQTCLAVATLPHLEFGTRWIGIVGCFHNSQHYGRKNSQDSASLEYYISVGTWVRCLFFDGCCVLQTIRTPSSSVGPPEITLKLRRAAFDGDVDEIARILSTSHDILRLAEGLKFDPSGVSGIELARNYSLQLKLLWIFIKIQWNMQDTGGCRPDLAESCFWYRFLSSCARGHDQLNWWCLFFQIGQKLCGKVMVVTRILMWRC